MLEKLAAYLQETKNYCKEEKWQQAVQTIEKALSYCCYQLLQDNPNLAKAEYYYSLGIKLQEENEINEAIHCYNLALELNPDLTQANYALAEILTQQKKWQQAFNYYRQVFPSSCNLRLLAEVKNTQKTPEVKKTLSSTNSEKTANYYINAANLLEKQKHYTDAIESYLQAIIHHPDLSAPYLNIHYNLLRYHIPDQAEILEKIIGICHKVIKEKPNLFLAYTTLAYALTKQGKIPQAISYYHRVSNRLAIRLKPEITKSQWQTATRKPPSFITIGAEKCGTTSLYHYLNQHPNLLLSIEKELDFFDREFSRGIDWYLAHFVPLPEDNLLFTGEISPNYIYDLNAPIRIKESFPEIKLMVILRNPLHRTVSRYNMMVKNGWETKTFTEIIDLEFRLIKENIHNQEIPWEILNQCRNIGNSLYICHLKRWLDIFPREQFLFISSEDLSIKPQATLKNIFDFLELPEHPLTDYNKYNLGTYSPIDETTTTILSKFFIPYNQELENYLGIKFNWD